MYMWFLLLSKIVKDTFRNKFGWSLSPFHRKVFKCHKNVCFNTLYFRSSRLQMFHEIGSPKNFSKYTGTHFCKSILFREVSIYSLQLYEKKRDSQTRVFPWSLRHFWEHQFCRRPSDECFCFFTDCELKDVFWVWRLAEPLIDVVFLKATELLRDEAEI